MSGGSPLSLAGFLHRLVRSEDRARQTDAELVRLFTAQEDEAAFTALVRRHGPMVFGVCRRWLRPADAEDAFQATFLVLMRRAGSIARPEALSAWLHGVAVRVSRKARSRRSFMALPNDLPGRAEPDHDLADALDEELDRLPEQYRLPILWCCFEGISRQEAARRLGISGDAVKGLLERGRRRLGERLARRGLVLGSFPVLLTSSPALSRLIESIRVLAMGDQAAPAVLELLEGVLTEMNPLRWKSLVALSLVGLVCASVGLGVNPRPAPRSAPALVVLAPVKPAIDPEPPQAPKPLTLDVKSSVRTVAYSPDGRTLLTGSDDGRVAMWDPRTGKQAAVMMGQEKGARCLAVSPDGRSLTVGDGAGNVLIWDLATRRLYSKSRVAKTPVTGVALSADGKRVVGVAGAGNVFQVDMPTGRLLATNPLGDGKEVFRTVLFASDGASILAGGEATSNTGELWAFYNLHNLAAKKSVTGLFASRAAADKPARANMHPAPAAFSADGKLWAGAAGPDLVFDFRQQSKTGHDATITALTFLRDAKTLVSGCRGGRIVFTDVATKKPIARCAGEGKILALALSPDGKQLAVATEEGKVKLHDVAKLQDAGKLPKP